MEIEGVEGDGDGGKDGDGDAGFKVAFGSRLEKKRWKGQTDWVRRRRRLEMHLNHAAEVIHK